MGSLCFKWHFPVLCSGSRGLRATTERDALQRLWWGGVPSDSEVGSEDAYMSACFNEIPWAHR